MFFAWPGKLEERGDDQQTRVRYIKARLARRVAMEDAQREAMRREQQKGRV